MTINHLNLVVADVAKAVNFFETYACIDVR